MALIDRCLPLSLDALPAIAAVILDFAMQRTDDSDAGDEKSERSSARAAVLKQTLARIISLLARRIKEWAQKDSAATQRALSAVTPEVQEILSQAMRA